MDYQKTAAFKGNKQKAFQTAINTLLPNGFEIVNNSENILEMQRPAAIIQKGQEAISGISKITVYANSNELNVQAQFDGIRKTVKFLIFLIAGMAVFFVVLFGVIFKAQQQQSNYMAIWLPLLSLAPWPVIIPVMAVWFRKRAKKAVDILLKNMIAMSN